MIRKSDWRFLGLGASAGSGRRFGVPAAASAAPLREVTDLYPAWAADGRDTLHVGLGCSLHTGAARALVAGFHRVRPDVTLALQEVDDSRATAELRSGDLDAAILLESAAREGLRSTPLWREPLYVAAPADHRFAACEEVDPADLRQEFLLLPGAGDAAAALRDAISRALGGAPATYVRQAVSRDTLLDLVALGFGVAVAPRGLLDGARPEIAVRPIASVAHEVRHDLVWRPDNRSQALHAFIAFARGGDWAARAAEHPA